jgi:propanediol utilization protein
VIDVEFGREDHSWKWLLAQMVKNSEIVRSNVMSGVRTLIFYLFVFLWVYNDFIISSN